MHIKLKWVNKNIQDVTTRIYRNDTAVSSDLLGAPLATLAAGVIDWIDTDVVRGQTYYYTIEFVSATESVFSKPIEVVAVSRTGPGPQELQFGDLNYGYFGEVISPYLFSATELASKVGLVSASGLVYTESPMWDKWARNGKICYMPRQALWRLVKWSEVYNAGLVYGVAGPGPHNAGTDVDQLKIVEKGVDQFIVRLPTAVDDRNNPGRVLPTDMATNAAVYRMYSEAADFLYPLSAATPPQQRSINIAQMTGSELGLTNVNVASMNLTQELNASKQWATLCLDHSGIVRSDLVGAVLQPQIYSSSSWRPILELVDTIEVMA